MRESSQDTDTDRQNIIWEYDWMWVCLSKLEIDTGNQMFYLLFRRRLFRKQPFNGVSDRCFDQKKVHMAYLFCSTSWGWVGDKVVRLLLQAEPCRGRPLSAANDSYDSWHQTAARFQAIVLHTQKPPCTWSQQQPGWGELKAGTYKPLVAVVCNAADDVLVMKSEQHLGGDWHLTCGVNGSYGPFMYLLLAYF